MSGPAESVKVSTRGNEPPEMHIAYSAQWLSQDQEPEWDTFVLRHPLGSVYHTSEWKRVIQQGFRHIRGRFLVLREGEAGRILAGLPIYSVSSWLLGNRLVSIP